MTEKNSPTKDTRIARPPIVAVLGHIDHGKSTLLDYIRKTNIVEKEAGHITQHVHAYKINHEAQNGGTAHAITFIDTPGHAAFATSRSRGAHIADIAILIVSAEEGVKEQTKESVRVIEKSATPFIVAINKIDRPNANIDRAKQELAEAGILVEGYGGTIPCVPISAKSGEGIDDLLDMIVLLAEMEELGSNTNAPATGFVLDSRVDAKKGITATFIVKEGTLTSDLFLVSGGTVSKIKRLFSFDENPIENALPSDPVIIGGLSELPAPGTTFYSFSTKKEADAFALENASEVLAQTMFSSVAETEGECATLALVIKADVIGTLDGIMHELARIKHPRAIVKVVRAAVGTITEDDVALAGTAQHSYVLGFHVACDKAATDLAREKKVSIKMFDIIYKLAEFVEKELAECAPTIEVETIAGGAKIIRVFNPVRGMQIIGARVAEGVVTKDTSVTMRIEREGVVKGKGTIEEMQIERVPVKRAEKNDQFGASVKTSVTLELGDELVFFTTRTE